MKTLILVSGGDAPGINAAMAHFVNLAAARGDSVIGVPGGAPGMLAGDLLTLTPALIAPWAGQPGTFLSSSREPALSRPDARERVSAMLTEQHIDNLLLFGGNGSLKFMLPLFEAWSVACIGIPSTIDNDVPGTDETLGFDSACNFAYRTIDGILATAYALTGRIFTIETLGGDSGMLALDIACGANADAVLIKEFEYSDEWLTRRLLEAVKRQGHALVVHGEGARGSRTLADTFTKLSGSRVRDTRLGHAQRGSSPSHRDRVLAAHMAHIAFDALHDGTRVGATVVHCGRIELHRGTLNSFPDPQPDRALYNRINAIDS